MSTALAMRDTALNPAGFGDKHAIAAIQQRIMSMIPGAADAPQDVVWAAAQLAVAYKLDPFNGEIYIMKLGKKNVGGQWVDEYRAHVGIKGLRKKAREQANFMTDTRTLSAEEVKAARRGDYDAGDIGVECTLWRLDVASECKRLDIPYKPVVATGFWRVKAKFNRTEKTWEPDNIPNTWTAHDVAEKRAEINAIKKAYDLVINVADPALVDDEDAVEVIGAKVAEYERDRQPVHRQRYVVTDDGEVVFEDDHGYAAAAQNVNHAPAYTNGADPVGRNGFTPEQLAQEYAPSADESNPFTDPTVGVEAEAAIDYGAIADTLAGQCKMLADWAYKQHCDGSGPASKAQYGYLTKTLDDHTGDGHTLVLSVLCRRHVTSENPCSKKLAMALLDVVLEKIPQKDTQGKSVKGDDGKVIYIDNPKFRGDVVDCLKAIAAL